MELKDTVSVNGLKPEMVVAIVVLNSCHAEVSKKYQNVRPVVLTSCVDGTHSNASLHYVGYAIDVRIRDWAKTVTDEIVLLLKQRLNQEYDVVLEKDHIHIEYQPKRGVNH